MHKFYLTLLLLVVAVGLRAQIVTTEPAVIQESSQGVTIFFHADQGNRELMNQPASDPVYAHTGVITSASTSSTDWKYAPTWLDNADKYRLTYVGPNLWRLDIGDIRTYYGITNPEEKVLQLAFVFRNSDGTKQGKTASGGDIFVDVVEQGLQVSLSCSLEGSIITEQTSTVTFTASCTEPALLSITVNGENIGSQANATQLVVNHTFAEHGSYIVLASATINELTVTDQLSLSYPAAGTLQDYPGGIPKMGTVRREDGSVIFCIAAPQKSQALLVGSWEDYEIRTQNSMHIQDYQGNRYFWLQVPGLSATEPYPYYFIIDGTPVGDPYARLVLDPTNDKYIPASVYPDLIPYPADKLEHPNVPLAVYQENLNDYDWQISDFHGVAKENLIIYELLIRDFTGTEGKALGDGTIDQARAKIPYLKGLGVNAVELLPINEFNGNISWGYNPNFYFAPDKAYGTPAAYKAFIDQCHAEGIAVILDMVFNQTDWMHPWYQLYPVGSNPFYNAAAPHAYSVLNDWNQGNPLVQQQFEDCLRYWLEEYKVDGFRFDLVKGLGDNDSYANSGDAATNAYNASRIARMKQLHAVVRQVKPDAYFINENLAFAPEENEMAEDGELNWANLNTQGGQYAMGYSADSSLKRFYAPDDDRTWGSTVSYLESHDEQRLAYLQNQNGATGVRGNIVNSMHRLGSAAAQMILSPGAHMIWQFSELGNYDNTKNANGGNNTDPKTVRWNLYDNVNRRGLYDNYAELIAIRANNPELFAQSASFTGRLAVNDWAQGRFIYLRGGEKELILAINPETDGQKTLPTTFLSTNNDDYQILSASYNTEPTFNAAASQVTVPANSYVVIANKKVKSTATISADTDVRIYGGHGCIVVEGADAASLSIYDIQGRPIHSLQVPAGLYLVRHAHRTFKVLVK